jgi:hypothetical protein
MQPSRRREIMMEEKATSYSLGVKGKPIIFLNDREREIDGFLKQFKDENVVKIRIGILDILYSIIINESISEEELDALFEFLGNTKQSVWFEAGIRLIQLSNYFPKVCDEMFNVMEKGNTLNKLHLIQSFWQVIPPISTTVDILKLGLKDKSHKVRLSAAQRCGSLKMVALLEELLKQNALEKNPNVLFALKFSIDSLSKCKE